MRHLLGASVRAARSGEEAPDQLEVRRAPCVRGDLPIIIVTTRTATSDVIGGLETGAWDCADGAHAGPIRQLFRADPASRPWTT